VRADIKRRLAELERALERRRAPVNTGDVFADIERTERLISAWMNGTGDIPDDLRRDIEIIDGDLNLT
jgi:hypothetical protein